MTLIFKSKEQVYRYRNYTIYISDDVKLMIDKRELKINFIEKLYLKCQ